MWTEVTIRQTWEHGKRLLLLAHGSLRMGMRYMKMVQRVNGFVHSCIRVHVDSVIYFVVLFFLISLFCMSLPT